MAKSQNGWPVFASSTDLDKNIGPVAFPNGVRPGDVAVVLGWVADWFHTNIEQLVPGTCWGWNYRAITGQTSGYSNHASGTALDFNAPKHPYRAVNTFSEPQRRAIREMLASLGGVVRWGGDYTGNHDDMHFEINATPESGRVAALAAHLRGTPPAGGGSSGGGTPAPAPLPVTETEGHMLVPATHAPGEAEGDDYISIPCDGKTLLCISTAFNRVVKVKKLAAVRDNQADGNPSYVAIGMEPKGPDGKYGPVETITADMPGPIRIDGGCRVVQMRYSADHPFTVWCA